MTSAKAWYWLGLGILALSFMTSGSGRSIVDHAGAYVSCVRMRALPYLGAIEIAMGRTQSGFGHMQAGMERARVQMEAQQARLEVAQARIEAAQQVMQTTRFQEQMRKVRALRNTQVMMDPAGLTDEVIGASRLSIPNVEVMNGAQQVIVCPRTRVRVAVPAVHVDVNSAQDPI